MMAILEGTSNLDDYMITALPASAFYIANFLSEEEETYLLDCIQNRPIRDWTDLSKRRLQVWPSRLSSSNWLVDKPLPAWLSHPTVPRLLSLIRSSQFKVDDAIPDMFDSTDRHVFASAPHGGPNHVLINEYKPGQGIMPHEDGAAYFPAVATISLGAPIVFDIYEKSGTTSNILPKYRILQEPRSLLITTDDLYGRYLHGIAGTEEDVNIGQSSIANWDLLGSKDEFVTGSYVRRTRTSLTFRDVLQVVKPTKLFPGIAGR